MFDISRRDVGHRFDSVVCFGNERGSVEPVVRRIVSATFADDDDKSSEVGDPPPPPQHPEFISVVKLVPTVKSDFT
jgi:hypothetical protein